MSKTVSSLTPALFFLVALIVADESQDFTKCSQHQPPPPGLGWNLPWTHVPVKEQGLLLKLPLPTGYYGQTFNYTYISRYGYVVMTNSKDQGEIERPMSGFPETRPNVADLPVIAVYYMDKTRLTRQPGALYYRYITIEELDFKKVIRRQFPQTQTRVYFFDYKSAVNRSFSRAVGLEIAWCHLLINEDYWKSPQPKNTFNFFIGVDDSANPPTTYTFNKYILLETEQQQTTNALTGFNWGDSLGWHPLPRLPGSDALLAKPPSKFNYKESTNHFYYELSSDRIIQGGCQLAGTTNHLELSPAGFTRLGGNQIYPNSECTDLDIYEDVFMTSPSGKVSQRQCIRIGSMFLGVCRMDMMTETGHYTISTNSRRFPDKKKMISIPNNFSSVYNIVPHSRFPKYVKMLGSDWMNLNQRNLTTKFSLDKLGIGYLDTRDDHVQFHIVKAGITKEKKGFVKSFFMRNVYPDYGSVLLDYDEYSADISDIHCDQYGTTSWRLHTYCAEFGFIVLVADSEAVWSNPIPLGWYINRQMTEDLGDNWLEKKCRDWSAADSEYTDWLERLSPCPCTLQQAIIDFGSWISDPDCNIFSSEGCPYHSTAIHCVESNLPNEDEAGNKCCYGKDNMLVYTQDTCDGGAPMRYHTRAPSSKQTLFHYQYDVMPWFYCCQYSGDRFHDVYAKNRPTKSCTKYIPPKFANAFGTSHIHSIDDETFTFGGIGEFWLVKQIEPSRLFLQGRYERITVAGNPRPMSRLTAVALQSTSIDTLEFRLNSKRLYSRRKIVVYYNGKRVWFDGDGEKWHDLKDLSVFTEHNDSSNFTVILKNHRAVRIATTSYVMEVSVSLPSQQVVFMYGILSPYSLNGAALKRSSVDQQRYEQLSKKWRTQHQESLFLYTTGQTHTKHNEVPDGYAPQFQPNNIPQQCQGDKFCGLDLEVTDDSAVASQTRRSSHRLDQARSLSTPVISCDPIFINKTTRNTSDFRVGRVVKLECCCNTYGAGFDTYKCEMRNGLAQWLPEVRFICKIPDNLVIVIGSIAGFVTLIIICIIVILYVRDKRKRQELLATDYRNCEQPPAKAV